MAPQTELVSIVIPCYNPTSYLFDAIASAQAQTWETVETIVVDDGTDSPEGMEILRSVSQKVHHFVQQPNLGLAAARNAGFRAATGSYVVPLDSNDVLQPSFIAECLAAMRDHQDAAFVYTDYRVFGAKNFVERLEDYNLYHLLDHNTLVYAGLIRKPDWALAGGYDETMKFGYEDWEFWLRLGARERFGHHVRKVLFQYRKHGPSLFDIARARHDELVAKIQSSHPELYDRQARARIKARWEPAVCVMGAPPAGQTIEDWQAVESTTPSRALQTCTAEAFLLPSNHPLDRHAAELAALAVWGGARCVGLPDGSVAASRQALAQSKDTSQLKAKSSFGRNVAPAAPPYLPASLDLLHRHLVNAELLSVDAWLRHPTRSAIRLIPLSLKQEVNRLAGRALFDLSFYLKFQPRSLMVSNLLVEPLRYMPKLAAARRRVALVTRHLGPGGAERVLLDIASSLDRSNYEILLIATHSSDARWLAQWQQHADHIYDLAPLVSPDRLAAAVYSIATNWQVDFFLVQNALEVYGAIPQLKRNSPHTTVMDLIHGVDKDWDVISATASVAKDLDLRVVISAAARNRLRQAGVEECKIRLIRNGIDLGRYKLARSSSGSRRILFAGRLDPVKRPLLLADIALALQKKRGCQDFQFLVAGDGPEEQNLRRCLRRRNLESMFVLLGYVPDITDLLGQADMLIIPSRNEGIPLVLLEALASARPVVASNAGAIREVLDDTCGCLIDTTTGEAERFAEAISALLDQSSLREQLGREGRRRIEAEYDICRSRQAYRQIFSRGMAAMSADKN